MNRYFKEVLDAHELIRDWLGNAETPDEVCTNLLTRFSPAFSMVTPGGALLDFDALTRLFRTQKGARAGLTLDIEDLHQVTESETWAVVTYQERQQLPGLDATHRFSTAVFEVTAEGRVIWRHLHETMR